MKWLVPVSALALGAAVASRPGARGAISRFRQDVRDGMNARESQLRDVIAMDTHLTLPGERAGARAIEGR